MGERISIHFTDDSEELLEWVDDRVDEGRFASRSHGIRFCVRKAKDMGVEEFV